MLTIRVSKVIGHAARLQVSNQEAQQEDKEGNDAADKPANEVVQLHGTPLIMMLQWVQGRGKKYQKLMGQITRVVANVILAGGEARKEEEAAKRIGAMRGEAADARRCKNLSFCHYCRSLI